ncbi:hypothetical protein [Mesorhizobium sp. M0816]|uniref:hypothetical protein n=1 Tax=unclassified Mesorhizobium TaxID=325217 RepID=UPI00333679FD
MLGSVGLLNLRARFSRRAWRAILASAFLHGIFRRRETILAFTMNGRLRCCGFIVLRHRPILSANGRHSNVDHGRAQERNPKQIHFRLRN